MKHSWINIFSLSLILFSASSLTSTQASIELPDLMEYRDTKLTLNGQGNRVMFFMKIYESGLYLNSANSNADEIISQDSAMGIRLDVISSILTAEILSVEEIPKLGSGKNYYSATKKIALANPN